MGHIFERIDLWAGKTLFVPLIIRACQQFKVSQHLIHRVGWFIACLIGIYSVSSKWEMVVFGLLAVGWCVAAGPMPDSIATASSRWFRILVLVAVMPFDGVRLLAIGAISGLAFDVIVLFAEYAATIKTIPPLEAAPKRFTQTARARNG